MPFGWPSSPTSFWRWETSFGACSSSDAPGGIGPSGDWKRPPRSSLAMEDERGTESDQGKARALRPAERFVEIDCGEARKHDQRSHFLDRLELCRRINSAADPVGEGHHETVFHEGDALNSPAQRSRATPPSI